MNENTDYPPAPPAAQPASAFGYYYPPHVYCATCGEMMRQSGSADKQTRTAEIYCVNLSCELGDKMFTVHALPIELTPKDA